MKIVLASASPRRRELLSRIVTRFEVLPAVGEERKNLNLPPEEVARALAAAKCDEVFLKRPDCLVIGCDTIVVYGGKILGKPKDGEEAFETLSALSGKTHAVITGVCIRYKDKKITDHVKTSVTFNKLDKSFIDSYVNSGSPMDKAGSYGIQDEGVVKSYSGSYTNVVGLPVELVEKLLKEVRYEENCN